MNLLSFGKNTTPIIIRIMIMTIEATLIKQPFGITFLACKNEKHATHEIFIEIISSVNVIM